MAHKRQKNQNNLSAANSVIDSQYELVWQNLAITFTNSETIVHRIA